MPNRDAKPEDFPAGSRVVYIPMHAQASRGRAHRDCEHGKVSSINASNVFVRFDAQVERLGWGDTTAQACYPWTLELE